MVKALSFRYRVSWLPALEYRAVLFPGLRLVEGIFSDALETLVQRETLAQFHPLPRMPHEGHVELSVPGVLEPGKFYFKELGNRIRAR